MKTIGLIGGTSWLSTVDYYRFINEETARRLGGLHSARLVLASIDFAELATVMQAGDWDAAGDILGRAAESLHRAGVDGIMLCSNLIHKVHDAVAARVPEPFLHIGDALAATITAGGYSVAALLGTRPIMEEGFYRERIEAKSGARLIVPDEKDRAYIDTAIFERMCRNQFTDEDRAEHNRIIGELGRRGAQCVILGCTELPVLLSASSLPLLSSSLVHSLYAVNWALDGEGSQA